MTAVIGHVVWIPFWGPGAVFAGSDIYIHRIVLQQVALRGIQKEDGQFRDVLGVSLFIAWPPTGATPLQKAKEPCGPGNRAYQFGQE